MMGINRVYLLGNVGGDPVVSVSSSGKKCVNFDVAVDSSYVSKAKGERITDTTWVPVFALAGLVDPIVKFIHRGSLIMIEGRYTSSQEIMIVSYWDFSTNRKRFDDEEPMPESNDNNSFPSQPNW